MGLQSPVHSPQDTLSAPELYSPVWKQQAGGPAPQWMGEAGSREVDHRGAGGPAGSRTLLF